MKREELQDSKLWRQAVALTKTIEEQLIHIPHTEVYTLVNPLHQTAITLTSDIAMAIGKGEPDNEFDYRYARGHLLTIKSLLLVAQELKLMSDASGVLIEIEALTRLLDKKLAELSERTES